MKISSSDADRTAKNPPRGTIAALCFGPDAGLARERAETLLKTVVNDLSDPFLVSDLDEQTLANDPARLADEAAAISMLGGRRVVRVRGATNELAEVFEAFLTDPKGDALVVIEAGDLAKGSALRKVFEDAYNAVAIGCYPDTASNLANVVRDALRSEGLSIPPDALAEAVSRLGSDRGVTRRELEKLVLYARGRKQVTLRDVQAVMGDEADIRAEEACDAAAGGDLKRLDLALERLWSDGAAPSSVLRAAMTHFQRLLLAHTGSNVESAIMKLGKPMHFSRVAEFKSQMPKWTETRLMDTLDLLLETEALCRSTGVPAEAICARALFSVAAMVR